MVNRLFLTTVLLLLSHCLFSQNIEEFKGNYTAQFDIIKMIEKKPSKNNIDTSTLKKQITKFNNTTNKNVHSPYVCISDNSIMIKLNENARKEYLFKKRNVKKIKDGCMIKTNDGGKIYIRKDEDKILLDTKDMNLILNKN
ncbi:MAG: hypothetical protein WCR29_06860 [Bacteroidales bacterium]|nr:hypothetical protein [Bacteroidales bacterium]